MGADLAVIACNTLHAFLPPIPKEIRLIHLIDETLSSLKGNPLVLATSTSARYRLHAPCRYPDSLLQKRLDQIVDQVLAGESLPRLAEELAQLLNRESDTEFLLGCTEFSLLNERQPLASFGLDQNVVLCDPYAVVAEKISSLTYGDGV
jgi:aspartate/glutamate racemase